ENLLAVREFLTGLGTPLWDEKGPVWSAPPDLIIEFLKRYTVDDQARSISPLLICAYIERQVELGELVRWTIAVRGRENQDRTMGEASWGIGGGQIWQLSRSRLRDT